MIPQIVVTYKKCVADLPHTLFIYIRTRIYLSHVNSNFGIGQSVGTGLEHSLSSLLCRAHHCKAAAEERLAPVVLETLHRGGIAVVDTVETGGTAKLEELEKI